MIKITKITLDSGITIGKHVLGHYLPHYSNPPLVRSCSANIKLGQQQYYSCSKISVGPMLGQCQHSNNGVLP